MTRLLLLLSLVIPTAALAATVAGVTLPDTAQLGESPLVLNGLALREKYYVDVYVVGLYLPAQTTSASAAMDSASAKQLRFTFVRDVTQQQLTDSIVERVRISPAAQHADSLGAMMEDVDKGQTLTMDYLPGQGTSIVVEGRHKGTIPGPETMQALFGIYLGEEPVTPEIKKALLGR